MCNYGLPTNVLGLIGTDICQHALPMITFANNNLPAADTVPNVSVALSKAEAAPSTEQAAPQSFAALLDEQILDEPSLATDRKTRDTQEEAVSTDGDSENESMQVQLASAGTFFATPPEPTQLPTDQLLPEDTVEGLDAAHAKPTDAAVATSSVVHLAAGVDSPVNAPPVNAPPADDVQPGRDLSATGSPHVDDRSLDSQFTSQSTRYSGREIPSQAPTALVGPGKPVPTDVLSETPPADLTTSQSQTAMDSLSSPAGETQYPGPLQPSPASRSAPTTVAQDLVAKGEVGPSVAGAAATQSTLDQPAPRAPLKTDSIEDHRMSENLVTENTENRAVANRRPVTSSSSESSVVDAPKGTSKPAVAGGTSAGGPATALPLRAATPPSSTEGDASQFKDQTPTKSVASQSASDAATANPDIANVAMPFSQALESAIGVTPSGAIDEVNQLLEGSEAFSLDSDGTTYEMQLDPHELGTVWVTLKLQQGRVTAEMVTTTDSARDLLQSQLERLDDSFQRVTVSTSGDGSQHGFADGRRRSHEDSLQSESHRPRQITATPPVKPPGQRSRVRTVVDVVA